MSGENKYPKIYKARGYTDSGREYEIRVWKNEEGKFVGQLSYIRKAFTRYSSPGTIRRVSNPTHSEEKSYNRAIRDLREIEGDNYEIYSINSNS